MMTWLAHPFRVDPVNLTYKNPDMIQKAWFVRLCVNQCPPQLLKPHDRYTLIGFIL